jgi:flagellar hook-associated protein 3 FlgL
MRVTDKMGYNQVITNLQKNRTDVSELQSQAALQKKVTKPSDDPIGASRVLAYRTDQRGSEQFVKNIQQAHSFLDFTDVSLGEASEVLVRLKELAIQQANDAGASPETRRAVAEEAAQTFKQMVQIANRKLGERYIFGGFMTTKQPFDLEGNYHGDDGDLKIHINKDAFLAMNLPGDKVFIGKGIGDGFVRPRETTPKTAEELEKFQLEESERKIYNQDHEEESTSQRTLASVNHRAGETFQSNVKGEGEGVNILSTVKNFEIALRANDKEEIQTAIDNLDECVSQIIHARAQVGGRLQLLGHAEASLRQNITDNLASASQVEDVDLFSLASEMNKADTALKASLETSGKLIQPSLLDFLK